MAAHSQITVKDLAEEAGLPLQCLNKTFREEDAHLLAEFCYPWESIAYHLKLTKADIYAIKNDKDTAELKRIATLETWSEKFAHKATYRVLIEAFIQGNRAKQALNLCKKIYLEIPAITADHSVSDDRCVDLSPLSTDQETNDSCDAPSEELVPDRDTTEAVYQLQMRFICIQNRFLQSGSGTRVTLEQLQTCISTLPSFTSDTPQLLLEATSVNLFTHHLKEYCCALNPDILVGLIEVLGDVETKTMIKEYNRDLRDFECKTKLKDFIGNYNRPTPPDYKEVELKLGDNWGEKTLADVKLINAQISRRSWLVKMVSIGSIYYVTFTIPQMEDVELDDHLKDSLQSQCVLQILVRGLCIFNCEAVGQKRPLEKSTEKAAEKRPCLESNASETNSVSPHLVELVKLNPLMKHRPKLAAFYSYQPEVPEGTWPPVKKTQYINLALIRTEQAIDFNKEFLRQTIRGSVDDIMKDKDNIKYDEVFTEVEEGARLVFEGRPGCGKTTMMNKVSQDWAKWKFFSSSLLFLVHLRRLENQSDVDLEMVLRFTPVVFTDSEFLEMCAQIETNQGKGVVFALDGLDEYCPEKKKYKLTFIHKLIKGEILPKSVVIVASRPAASQKYRRDATKCIEVLGFLKQQIYQYIDSYFVGDEGKVLGLRTYLEHHPNVMHMCYLPLHMAMVAYLYDIEGASLPQTETEIYKHFTLSTLLRSIRRKNGMELDELFVLSTFEDLPSDDREIFDLILELAFQATVVKPRQVFSAEDIQKFFNKQPSNTGNDGSSLGLVVVDRYFVKYGLKEIYTFLHLTFQEYLAACHIVQLSSEDQQKLTTKYGNDKKLGVVWKFYCGMTQFSDEQKMRNFERLFESTKSDVLLQLHCAHESQQVILCTHMVKSYDSKILLNTPSLNPADFTALGYVLTHSNVPATELAITSCNIGPEGLSALAKAIGISSLSLRTISFHRTKIKKTDTRVLWCFKAMSSVMYSYSLKLWYHKESTL